MRCLDKNKRPIIALNYIGKQPVYDDEGNLTGEYLLSYSEEILFKANISGARGSTAVEVFGTDVDYDKAMVLSKEEYERLGLTDNSVFFIDKKPEYETNGYPKYDYRVKRIAETINEVAIALERVRNNG